MVFVWPDRIARSDVYGGNVVRTITFVAKGFPALGVTGAGSDKCSRRLSEAFRERADVYFTVDTQRERILWLSF